MADYKHFSQYLSEAQAKAGTTGKRKLDFGTPVKVSDKQSENPSDFLSTVVDILSRPLYAVTNVPNQILNEISKANEAEKTGQTYDGWGAAGNILTSPLRGFFSNDVADKATTAQLIEKVSDVSNQNNPGYVDVQNNANPVAAGIAGFIGDVAFDPLTYIPIAGWIGKGVQWASKGAKAATEGISASVAAANALRRSGETLDATTAGAEAAAKALDDILGPEIPTHVNDIKPTADVNPTVLPKGTTSETSLAETTVAEAEKAAKAAEKATATSKAKEAGVPVVEDVPARITTESPTVDQILANLPKNVKGRTALGAMGHLLEQVRQGKTVKAIGENRVLLTPEKWRDAIRERIAKNPNKTDGDVALLEKLRDPKFVRQMYEYKYRRPFEASGGTTGLLGKPLAGAQAAKFNTMDEWLNSLDQKSGFISSPNSAEFKPFGQDLISPEQIREVLQTGSLNGEKISQTAYQKFMKELEASYKEDGGILAADKAAQDTTSFVTSLREAINNHRKSFDDLFTKPLVAAMIKMGDDKLDATARLIQDIASGQRSLSGIVDWTAEAQGSTIERVMKALSGYDSRLENVVDYNIALRKAFSDVNSAKREEIATALNNGMTMEEAFQLSGLTSEAAARVKQWLPEYLQKTIDDYRQPYITTADKMRTHELKGEGFAYDVRELSSYDTWNMVQQAMKYALNEAKVNKLSGVARAEFVRRTTMTELAMAEKVFDTFGWPLWTGIPREGSRFLLSPSQLFAAIRATDAELLNLVQFNGSTAGAYTFMTDAIVESLTTGKPLSLERLTEILTGQDTAKYYATLGKKFDQPEQNGFVSGGNYGFLSKEEKKALGTNAKLREISGEELIQKFHDAMPQIVANIGDTVRYNTDTYFARFKGEAGDLSNDAIKDMEALAADPARMGKLLDYIDNLEQNISLIGREGATLDLSILRGIEVALGTIPSGTTKFARSAGKGAKKAKSAYVKATGEKVKPTPTGTKKGPEFKPAPAPKPSKPKTAKQVDKEMEQAAQPALAEQLDEAQRISDDIVDNYNDLPELKGESPEVIEATKVYSGINAGVTSLMKPTSEIWSGAKDAFGRRLYKYYGMPRIYNAWHSLGITTSQIRSMYTKELHALVTSVKGGRDVEAGESVLRRVFSDMQRGVTTQGYEDLSKALKTLTAEVHDVMGDVPMFNDPFFRSQQGIETINEYLAMKGVKPEFLIDLDKAKQAAEANKTDLWTEASKQWRELNVADPIQYLAQRHAALMEMNKHIATAASFNRMAKANGLISTVEKPGFVKAKGVEGFFFKFLPQDVYYEATLMKELQHLSDVSQLSRSLDGRFGEIINKYIMPIQNTWKYAITLPRPGHHVRNMIGTLSLIYMAEGPKGFMKASRDAFKVLSVRNNYTDVDLFKALREQGINDIPRGGDVLFTSKGRDITNDWAYEAAQREGLLPTYHVGEDYVDDIIPKTKFSTVLDKAALRGGRIERTAGAISEYRDHHGRIQHFLQILRKHANDPNFKSLDDLVEYASKRVKKYNPDSTMLTAWEAKYMRTLIPFYSWFRGALPALVESTVLYPGRFMTFPKASFNLAYSMGVNPDTLYDPFPTDQMFPSFLREQIQGPVMNINGTYFGMNPGIAAFDVYNQLGQDPVRGIAGMTSPLFRVPMELLSGGSWGTGAKIKDTSDYIDASIPGVNYLANMSGVSPTGSIASILQGKGFDPQYQIAAGNRTGKDQLLSFINWMSGLGFQNYSKPNYINYAEIEKRNAAAKEGK